MADKKSARSPKEIEADIAATRSRMSRTVDELTYRINPQTLKTNAVASLKAQIDLAEGIEPVVAQGYEGLADRIWAAMAPGAG